MSKHFCVAPWIHLYALPTGKVIPCCSWPRNNPIGDLKTQTVDEIANSPYMDELRAGFMRDEYNPNCIECYGEDNLNDTISIRGGYNSFFKKLIPIVVENTEPSGKLKYPFEMKKILVQPSNLCNYACRSCGADSSSTWAEEIGEETPVHKMSDNVPGYMDIVMEQLKTAEHINFSGGEPVLLDEFWQVMDRLIELNRLDVAMFYNTNLSKLSYHGKSLIEYVKKFSNFKLSVSLDATHERAELYRHGTVWSTTEKYLKQLMDTDTPFTVRSTIGATNVWHWPDAEKYLLSNGLTKATKAFVLVNNDYMSVKILPLDFKQEIVAKIREHQAWLAANNYPDTYWEGVITFMLSEDHTHLLPKFIEYNQILDKTRNQNLFETFPELQRLLTLS